ncbi:hypothetical protein CPB84DRAFT_1847404 [Gymnopilus junonius]|uniref:DUF6534 domain-containing protein n=1 Tax=Gymnopilus junonius TaxID=109634 RepID=A0A9P5NNF5_GYMJU|nr:hypothetical protein CPB84DRAFT_1847404 [Gymnopilus junonius]
MNSTTTIPALGQSGQGLPDVRATLAAAFFGFSAGAILYGITIRQAFQYYTTCTEDSKWRKFVIAIVCLLDTIHLIFSMYLVYTLILQLVGYPFAGPTTLSLKALGSAQTFLILFVQGFYLSQIWKLSENLQFLTRRFSHAVHQRQFFVIFIAVFAIAVAVVFLSQLQKINSAFSFAAGFEYVVYLGFGATAVIDCAIAAAMCLMLNKGNGGLKTESIVESLIQYFIGSGLITSFAAILCITLYVAQPNTLLYLGMELSVTRLYANSVLAMFNARSRLRKRLNESVDLNHVPSFIHFRHPESTPQTISLLSPTASSPFSPGQETKYSKNSEWSESFRS